MSADQQQQPLQQQQHEEMGEVSPVTPPISSLAKKAVDPKTVRKLLIRTASLKKRRKIMETWMMNQTSLDQSIDQTNSNNWNDAEAFLTSILLNPSFLSVCFDLKFQSYLATIASKAIMKQSESDIAHRLSLFAKFVQSYDRHGFLSYVHVQSTLVQVISSAIVAALLSNFKSTTAIPVLTNVYQVLVDILSRLYAEHPEQYCQHMNDLNKFEKTHAFKCAKRVASMLSSAFGNTVNMHAFETFLERSDVNAFAMTGALHHLNFAEIPDDQNVCFAFFWFWLS